jgi:Zn-dependent protease with chaperone function
MLLGPEMAVNGSVSAGLGAWYHSRPVGYCRKDAMTSDPPRDPASGMPQYPSVPGPFDRVSFVDEQKRRRRETWKLSAACAVSVILVGIPLSMIVTPFVFLAVLLPLKVTDWFVPVPQAVFNLMRQIAGMIPAAVDSLLNSQLQAVSWTEFATDVVVMLAPGMLVILFSWFFLRRLFLQAGTGGVLLALKARAPRSDDLEERQLVNVTEEMGIAAGLPPPKLMLLDEPVANAAVVGSSPADATILITRKLLDECSREETQAVIGHLVGSVGHGDLRISLTILSVFNTFGLVLTAFQALFGWSGSACRELFSAGAWALRGGRHPQAADAVARLLSSSIGRVRDDDLASEMMRDSKDPTPPKTWLGRLAARIPVIRFLFLPFMLIYLVVLVVQMEVFMLRLFVVGPLVVWLWRTRRYLADAVAVQLTRNPDSLAAALRRLQAEDTSIPGTAWAEHLFIVGSGKKAKDANSGQLGSAIASHPPVEKRLRRLVAQGARESLPTRSPWHLQMPRRPWEWALLMALIPLLLVMAYLMLFVIVAISGLAAGFALTFLGAVMLLIQRLLL